MRKLTCVVWAGCEESVRYRSFRHGGVAHVLWADELILCVSFILR